MILDSVDKVLAAWYRLAGTTSDDEALVEQGEAVDDVAYQSLTRGCRIAQRWMLDVGYGGWRKRSAALTFSGTDAANGGKYVSLPDDCLRIWGRYDDNNMSPLRQANGDPWGRLVAGQDDVLKGDYCYVRGEQLWLTRTAQPPATLYLDYHYQHPTWDTDLDDADIDFPVDARYLIIAEGVNVAKEENWYPLGADGEQRIERALVRARNEAIGVARQHKSPRRFRKPTRMGNIY